MQHIKTNFEKRSGSIMFLCFVTINLKNGFLNFFEIGLNNEKNYDLGFFYHNNSRIAYLSKLIFLIAEYIHS